MRETDLPVALKLCHTLPNCDRDPYFYPNEVAWHRRASENRNSGVIELIDWMRRGYENQALWIVLERPDPCETLLNYRMNKCKNKTPKEIEVIAWKIFKQVTFGGCIMLAQFFHLGFQIFTLRYLL